ncbi:MAG: PAAR domain-containing protein [Bacteroidetes bacterium]|nr:PAAR domain-containing protein [Bacteroidota bacterium]
MSAAARIADLTSHGGTVTGPGEPTVLIGGMPAAVANDMHVCALPPSGHQPTSSPFLVGSTKVLIAGKPAIRAGDACLCGASVVVGEPTVLIG